MSGTLRGFYDDNYNTAATGPSKRGSFGFEVSPSVGLNVPLQQTELGLRYTYGLYYYQDREEPRSRTRLTRRTSLICGWIMRSPNAGQAKVQDTLAVGRNLN